VSYYAKKIDVTAVIFNSTWTFIDLCPGDTERIATCISNIATL